MMLVPTARSVAATVIARVIADKAFAAAALDAELERAVQLDGRDRGLATELVYGTLRLYGWLEERIERHAPRGLGGLDPIVRAHLVIAAYQVFVLTRVPAFAAVSEAVSAIRAARGAHVAGFANAVLRKVSAEPRPTEEEISRAAVLSIDSALRDAIVRAIGDEGARALLGANVHGAPPLGLRIEDPSERDRWLTRFRDARPNATFELGRISPHAVLARGAGKVVLLPGYEEGAWTPQEEGSQLVALALGAREGDVVLDACAGRGNKTGLLARAVGSSGAVDVADAHPKKLDRLTYELERISQRPRAAFAVDWSRGVGDVVGGYDRVLIDAPCSGTGTLRRRPELGLRRSHGDIKELAVLQRAILTRAASLVKPGGRVVYAVCSVLREEAEEVVSAALADQKFGSVELEPAPFDAPALSVLRGDAAATETTLRLLPHEHGTDGYFIASFVRRAAAAASLSS